jgi:hypothetical protein
MTLFTVDEKISMVTTEYGVVMLNMRSGAYFELNQSGALVLDVLVNGGDVAHATRRLTAEYDIDEETARQDAAEILADLVSAGILRERVEGAR